MSDASRFGQNGEKITEKKKSSSGGWLGFFIFTLGLGNPMLNLFLLISGSHSTLDWFDILPRVSLFILAAVFLMKEKPYAIQFTKIILITEFIIDIISIGAGATTGHPGRGIVYSLIWISYLYQSKQVKAVYGGLKEDTEGYSIWAILSIVYAIFSPIFAFIFAVVALLKLRGKPKLKGRLLAALAIIIAILAFFTLVVLYASIELLNEQYAAPESIKIACGESCSNVPKATHYQLEYNFDKNSFVCSCTEDSSNVLTTTDYEWVPKNTANA